MTILTTTTKKPPRKTSAPRNLTLTYVLKNRLLWYIAVANVFVYLIRYGVLKWSPVYLSEVKHFDFKGTAIAYTIYELAAIPGTRFVVGYRTKSSRQARYHRCDFHDFDHHSGCCLVDEPGDPGRRTRQYRC